MCLDDHEIKRRVASNTVREVRLRSFEFTRWARDELGLCPENGDDRWQAIDLRVTDEVVARIFPKEANLLKIHNVRGKPTDSYGWSFSLSSSQFDEEIAKGCLRDQVEAAKD
jgi:hypothetical protein